MEATTSGSKRSADRQRDDAGDDDDNDGNGIRPPPAARQPRFDVFDGIRVGRTVYDDQVTSFFGEGATASSSASRTSDTTAITSVFSESAGATIVSSGSTSTATATDNGTTKNNGDNSSGNDDNDDDDDGDDEDYIVAEEEDEDDDQDDEELEEVDDEELAAIASDASNRARQRAAAASNAIGIDLLCKIAACMAPGVTLFNLCISVCRDDARQIRTEYLRDNDDYLARNLRVLMQYSRSRSLFDKVRDNILTWMAVNTDWRGRVTPQNVERYRRWQNMRGIDHLRRVLPDINLIFNNPAIAIEIGLLDVLRNLVEDVGIDVNRRQWTDFNTTHFNADDHDSDSNNFLIDLALLRGDTDILHYLLSTNGFDMSRMIRPPIATIGFASHEAVSDEMFQTLILHPSVDANMMDEFGATPLLLSVSDLSYNMRINAPHDAPPDARVEYLRSRVRRIGWLLEAGANPLVLDPVRDVPLIQYAQGELEKDPDNEHWTEVVEMMEQRVDAMGDM